jgi:5'-methylthioadenosine phosphorylase
MTQCEAEIGVFGGSGFYSLMDSFEEIKVETPYGPPSDKIAIGTVAGKKVAFLPRHGKSHQFPPHAIPYRANVYAMKLLGVTRIIGPNAVGSLQAHIKPGDFVVCDQFVDRTSGRKDTFYDGPITTHISTAEPYCPTLRQLAVEIAREQGVTVHDGGTCVVIQGPRFSTRAESLWFTKMGWSVVNMTQYPECVLALEQEMCYVNIALVTDYDVGIVAEGGAEPVSAAEIINVLNANNERVKKVIFEMIKRMPDVRDCPCASALKYARLG